MNKRNPNLDLIKCLACFFVVGLHSVGMVNYSVYYLCDCGVPLFFMVNGYLMFSRDKIDYSYAFRKIASLLKIVVLWNLLILLPVLIFRHKLVNPIRQCAESLFQKGYLWHFWFFGSLMLLYLLLPLLHRFLKNNRPLHRIACLLLMGVCTAFSIFSMCSGYSIQMFIPQTLRLWTWLFFFLFGGLCAVKAPICPARLFFSSKLSFSVNLPLWLHGLLTLLLTLISNTVQKKAGLYLIHNRLADLFYDNITSILWYVFLFTFLLRIPIREQRSRLITFFSSLTMGIFILHPLLLTGINSFYTPASTVSAVSFWVLLTILSGVCCYALTKIPLVRTLVKL